VPEPALQHAVMIEAVENHMPEVIVIDEIGTEMEAFAARTIAERGVQLVGTAHGNTLENLMMNPTLSDLIGGIQPVTLSDEEARRRGTQKTVLERKAPPTFDVVIEMIDKEKMAIHHDVAETVDSLLRGRAPRPEIRERTVRGEINVIQEAAAPPRPLRDLRDMGEDDGPTLTRTIGSVARITRERSTPPSAAPTNGTPPSTITIYPYGVSRGRLEKAIKDLRVPAALAKTWDNADAVVALKAHYRREPGLLRGAIAQNKPTFVVRSNTQVQIEAVLRQMFDLDGETDEAMAMREAEQAIERVQESGEPVELMPQNAYLRRLQHQIVEASDLHSSSVGAEPQRRIRISKR
jgi:hypothetical protein